MCSLEVFTLDEHPAYEALSYTWDKQPPALPILVNDKVVTVSQGVDTALRHLPRADAARVLWIDALCIDQGNIFTTPPLKFSYGLAQPMNPQIELCNSLEV
jgi:hypothetical protein